MPDVDDIRQDLREWRGKCEERLSKAEERLGKIEESIRMLRAEAFGFDNKSGRVGNLENKAIAISNFKTSVYSLAIGIFISVIATLIINHIK